MAFTQTSLFVPAVAAVDPVTAGISIGAGWQDRNGSIWSINSSGYLVQPTSPSSSGWYTAQLIRETAVDNLVDSQVVARYTHASNSGNNGIFLYSRYVESAGKTNGFCAGVYNGKIQLCYVVANALTTIKGTTAANLTAGSDYDVRTTTVQTDSATTTVTVEFFSVTAAGSALCSGTLMSSDTVTNTTASLQNVAGYPGVFFNVLSGQVKMLATFTDVAVTPATALVVSGPGIGVYGQQSLNWMIETNGSLASDTVVTLSDGGAGGTFSPATVTLTAGSFSQATFTYTSNATQPNVSGTGGGLTSNTITPNQIAVIGVTDSAISFSPGNWRGDTGRGGTAYRQTWNMGAYFSFSFNASASPLMRIMLPTVVNNMQLTIYVNGVVFDSIGAGATVTVSGLKASALNLVEVFVRTAPTTNTRWSNGTSVLKVLGVQIDAASSQTPNTPRSKWVLMVGDSITEGYLGTSLGYINTQTYSHLVGRMLQQLGYEFGISACAGNGWLTTGDANYTTGDVPPYYYVSGGVYNAAKSRWNLIDASTSLLDANGQISAFGDVGTTPSAIWINMGTNDALGTTNTSDVQASVLGALTALRGAAPDAQIILGIPLGLQYPAKYSATYPAAIIAGYNAYLAANPYDRRISLLNGGTTLSATLENGAYVYTDLIHQSTLGHALMAPLIGTAIVRSLAKAKTYTEK